jgi:hypothetical protein
MAGMVGFDDMIGWENVVLTVQAGRDAGSLLLQSLSNKPRSFDKSRNGDYQGRKYRQLNRFKMMKSLREGQ